MHNSDHDDNSYDRAHLRLVQVDIWVPRTELPAKELQEAVADDIIDSVRGAAYTIMLVDARAEPSREEALANYMRAVLDQAADNYISDGLGQLEDYINGGAQ